MSSPPQSKSKRAAPTPPRRGSRLRRWTGVAGLLLVAGGVAFALFSGRLSLREITDTIAGFNAAVVLLLMAVLPIAGFSVAVMYVVAGVKFGPYLGGVAVAAATAVHLLASYWIGQTVMRAPLQRFLERRNHHLPHVPVGENASIAAMAALVPGLPYFARNYLLALTEVPLRVYFWVCWPIYVVRSYVAILLGDLGTEPNRRTLGILITVYAVKLAICGYLIWRIRRRIRSRNAASAGARKARAGPNASRRRVSEDG